MPIQMGLGRDVFVVVRLVFEINSATYERVLALLNPSDDEGWHCDA